MSYDSQTSTILINKLRKDVDSLTLKIAVLQDVKNNNVAGGTPVTAVWTARTLNTISSDPNGLILQLASNQWKVAAGDYQVKVLAPFHHTRGTRLRIYDVTNSVVIGYGPSLYINNGVDMEVSLNLRITPHKDNVYRLEYYCERGGHADGLGIAANVGQPEIYTTLEITRLDTGATKPLGAGGLQGPQGPAGPTGPAGPPGPTGGGVTSVNVSGGTTGLTTSGGPITSSGTITLGGVLAVASGGTGATTAPDALTSLGAYPASNPANYTSNGGTVTSVSVTTANGVSGTVTNPTTTPAISLALGAITPSSVAASGAVTGSNLSGSNTGDQTITLTGDVTGTGTGSFAATIANNAVTYAKMQAASAVAKLIGSNASGTALGEITLGTNLSMAGSTLNAAVASGSVTSVNADGGTTGFSFSGGPITSSGTLSMTGKLGIGSGGTNATTASDARANLGLAIGTDIPALDGTGATGTWNIDVLGSAGTITSTLPINKGGTGATTAAGALTNLGAYPDSNPAGYTANAGTVTNVSATGGANISVATGSTTPVISQNAASSTQNGYMTSTYAAKLDSMTAGASVSSVSVSGGSTGLTTSGSPITASGTITLDGVLSVANGGTSSTSASSAISFLAGATTNGQYLRGNGTVVQMSAIQAIDLPQIALGGSAVSGTLGVINGGTGQSNVFSDGDLLIGKSLGSTLARAKLTAGANISITNGSGTITIAATGTGTGDVVGPASATLYELPRFSSTTGKAINGANWYSNGGDLYGDAGFRAMTYGFVWIPSGTGGQPNSAPAQYGTLAGRAPMYFDRTNSRLYIFNEDIPGWKYVDLV
ncbi:MAG: hypothetical protein QM523_08950 [Candidatus Pacebacteria bacterium]|nr:hypothetical protein [Candidatus Paceibacterota bacterium]